MYQLGNFLSQLEKAQILNLRYLDYSYTSFVFEISYLLLTRGYIKEIKDFRSYLRIFFKPCEKFEINLLKTQCLSKSSQTFYWKKKYFSFSQNGLGYVVVATPKGIIIAEQARLNNIGGILLFKIY